MCLGSVEGDEVVVDTVVVFDCLLGIMYDDVSAFLQLVWLGLTFLFSISFNLHY
jgi:hypothetical protein